MTTLTTQTVYVPSVEPTDFVVHLLGKGIYELNVAKQDRIVLTPQDLESFFHEYIKSDLPPHEFIKSKGIEL